MVKLKLAVKGLARIGFHISLAKGNPMDKPVFPQMKEIPCTQKEGQNTCEQLQ